jgi:hypothetical protein
MLLLLCLPIVLLTVWALLRRKAPTPPPPAIMDLAGAQREIARLKAELAQADEALRFHDIGPLRSQMEEDTHTIRALKRVLDEKLAVNSELHARMMGGGLMYVDANAYMWNSIMESFSNYNDMVWFSERMRECVALEDALLKRQPRLRDSIECMRGNGL